MFTGDVGGKGREVGAARDIRVTVVLWTTGVTMLIPTTSCWGLQS